MARRRSGKLADVAARRWLGVGRKRKPLREALHDPDVFAAFYEAEATQVVRYVGRRVLDPDVALDLAAESFAVALASLSQLRATTREEEVGWLYAIVRSQLSAYWRRGRVERRVASELGVDPIELSTAELERLEELIALDQARPGLLAALGELPAEQRTAVSLRVVEENSYAVIAQRLAVSEQVVRARVSRGLRRLGRMLEQQCDEEEAA